MVHAVCVQNGFTSLHGAAHFGYLHIIRELLEKMNADILAQTSVRVTLSYMYIYIHIYIYIYIYIFIYIYMYIYVYI